MDDFYVTITKKSVSNNKNINLETKLEKIDLCNYCVGISQINFKHDYTLKKIDFDISDLLQSSFSFKDFLNCLSIDFSNYDNLKIICNINSDLSNVEKINKIFQVYFQAYYIDLLRKIEVGLFFKKFNNSESSIKEDKFFFDDQTKTVTGSFSVLISLNSVYFFFNNISNFEPIVTFLWENHRITSYNFNDSNKCFKFSYTEYEIFKHSFPPCEFLKYIETHGFESNSTIYSKNFSALANEHQELSISSDKDFKIINNFKNFTYENIQHLSGLYESVASNFINNYVKPISIRFDDKINKIVTNFDERELKFTCNNIKLKNNLELDKTLLYDIEFPLFLKFSSNIINSNYFNDTLSNLLQVVPLENSSNFKTKYFSIKNENVETINISIESDDSDYSFIKFRNNFILIQLHFKKYNE